VISRQTRFDMPLPESLAFTCDSLGATAWLDIETTGLMPTSSHVTLIGYLRPGNLNRSLTQLFAEEPSEEPELLQQAFKDLADADLLITYNGRRFDLPFLRRRAFVWGFEVPKWRHRDLFDDVARLDPLRRLFPDHRLQTVMHNAGLARSDASDGRAMILAYLRWLEHRLPEDREEILTHNADDLVQLPDLTAYLLGRLRQRTG